MILKCWHPDPEDRATPQSVMKEMNKILYIVFNAKKVPQYVYIDQPPFRGSRSGKNQITALIYIIYQYLLDTVQCPGQNKDMIVIA